MMQALHGAAAAGKKICVLECKIKPIALSVIELLFSEGTSKNFASHMIQSGSNL